MKRIIFFMALMVGVINANAQSWSYLSLAAGDSAVNTGSASKVFTLTGGYSGVTIKAKVTKYTGTAGSAGNIAVLYEADALGDYVSTGDSATLTSATTQVFYFHKSVSSGNGRSGGLNSKYKVILYGAGTVGEILTVGYCPWFTQTKH